MSSAPVPIVIVYLGSRGAGPKLVLGVAEKLHLEKLSFYLVVSSTNELLADVYSKFRDQSRTVELKSKFSLLSIFRFIKYLKILKTLRRKHPDAIMVYLMPHPWDFYFAPRGSSFRVIHDATKHPGDGIWPTNGALKKRVLRGDEVICLSETVSSEVERLGVSAHRCTHPTFLFGEKEAVYRDPNSVLFIGRQRKYKGGELLANSWPMVLEKLPSAKLIVAGEGLVNHLFFKLKNVKILNHWLSEYEISELLQASSVAVFPYIEASQSGLIASADHYGTKIVSTAVGGLTEQTVYFGGTLVEELNPHALAKKIVESLTSQKVIAVNQTRSSPDVDLYNFVCSLAK